MHVERPGTNYAIRSQFSNMKLVGCCEDAYLCKAERDGKPYLILDGRGYDPPGTLKVMQFNDEVEREAYLAQQFGFLVRALQWMGDAEREAYLADILDLIEPRQSNDL
jgi:hypothetical protein